jgi:coenzyme F420 hydrogenase subunit beta
MCIGCGACVAVDPSLQLQLDPKKQGFRPSHAGDRRAASVCPAISVDFAGLHEHVFPGQHVGPHGVVDSVWLAQSTHHERNLKASSGGLIKELLHTLLAENDVDGIISLVHVDRLQYGAALITETNQIDNLPGSIYHAVDFSNALKLLREADGRFVLVAIPCQLEGIFSYIYQYDPSLAKKIRATIGLLCGWQYTHHAIRAISEYVGVDFRELTDIAWRGGGPIGKLRLDTAGEQKQISRRLNFSYQVAFDRSFNIPRCHLCINHSNFLADIVVGDAWLPSTVFTRTGISILICRAPWTRGLVHSLESSGRIVTTQASEQDIIESQSRSVVFGDFAYAYQEYLRTQGLPYADMSGPNRSCARMVDKEVVRKFHFELETKLELQARHEYRRLWWRKLTLELPALSRRYINWFLNRILRIKSIKGERNEIAMSKLRVFR